MKMAEERDTTNKSKDVLYGGESYNLEMSTQENPKKDDESYDESPESPHSDYEYSLREENIRLKSRLEQAKEKALLLEKNVTQYKEELQKEKEFSEKANKTIYNLMNDKKSMEDELNRKQSSGHHKGVEEVVRKLEHEIHLLEERLDRQRKRHHHEHLLLYDDLKSERRKQQEWKQTYLRSQVSVMAFRRKLELMKDQISPDDHAELMKCLEVGLNDYEDYMNDRKDENCQGDESRHHEEDDSHVALHSPYQMHAEKNSPQSRSNRHDTTTHRDNHDRHHPHEINHGPMDAHSNHKNTYEKERSEKYRNGTSFHGTVSLSYKEHSPRHSSRESPSIDSNHPKVFIMDDENTLRQPKHHNDSHSPMHVETSHRASPLPYHQHGSGVSSSSYQRYELDSNKHHRHHMSSPNATTSPSQKRHSGEGNHHHSSSSERSSTHYKHWHHYSVDNPGHNSRSSSALNRSDLRHDDELRNGHTSSSGYHSRDDSKYTYKSKFTDYSNDQLDLNVNDTKFLELKFDNGFLKSDGRSGPRKIVAPHLENSGKSVMPPGTPLEHKKVWCLTCDGEVTKKPCGHSSLVVQEREKEFPCPTCHRIFNNRSHLKRHNMIHSGEKPWACTYCEKRFNRKSHLNRHLLTHTGERPFKCPYCGKGFADNSDLKRHKQIHESTPGFIPIRPKEPPPVTTTTAVLVSTAHVVTLNQALPNNLPVLTSVSDAREISFVKTGENSFVKKKSEPRFPCNKCGKVFTRKSHLTRHKLTHDQVKIYCDCGRMFRQNAHLQAHLPACKRKRDAIEAKYLAQHGKTTQNDVVVKEEENPPSPLNNPEQPMEEDRKSDYGDIGNNNEGECNNEESHVSNEDSRGDYKNRENGSPSRKDVDLAYNFTVLPSGIPPLIRDPVQ